MSDMSKSYTPVDAYIYFYHTDEYFILPQFPESINDQLQSSFASQNALSRTAPVYSYSNSGPRTVQFTLQLHRDMMNDTNVKGSNVQLNRGMDSDAGVVYSITNDPNETTLGIVSTEDYVDLLIKKLQSVALPRYKDSDKSITPPRVAIRFSDEIFCKGIVNGGVSVDYKLPLLSNNKYAQVVVSFTVTETVPYDADSVGTLGSFRGLTSGLRAKVGLNKQGE